MSIRTLAVAVLTIALATTTACAHTQYGSSRAVSETKSSWNSFFLWGLAGSARIDAAAMCPNGIAGVETYASFGQMLLFTVTLGIYAPRTVEVHCAAAVAANDNKKVLIGIDDHDAPVYVARQTVAGKVELVSAKGGAR